MNVPPIQPPLGFDYRATVEAAGLRLLGTVGEAIVASGKQGDDFAAGLGVDPGQLSRALAGRGTHFAVKWLPAVIWRDPENRVARHVAQLAGGEFIPRPKMSRQDENELVRKYVEERLGELGVDVLKRALGEES